MNPDWIIDLLLVLLLAALAVLYVWLSRRGTRPREDESAASDESGPSSKRRFGYEAFLRQAGLDPQVSRWSYWAAKLFLGALLPLLVLLTSADGQSRGLIDPLVLGLGGLGFFLPDLWLWRVRRTRRRRIQNALSYFIDLTVALLHSGLNLEQAFVRAAREGFPPSNPLAEEALILGRELELGKDRSEAFDTLAERTGVKELRPVASALSLSSRRGTSVVEALEAQADLLRDQRRERAMRRVQTSGVLAVLPILLCGLPIFAVVVYFPAWLRLMETLRLLNSF